MSSTNRMILLSGVFAMLAGTAGCMSNGSGATAQSQDDAWCSAHPKQCDNKDWCAKHSAQCSGPGGN
jgi:hypothetical protein